MRITALYAALLGLLFLVLSVQAVRVRRRLRIPVGDGGDAQMLRAMRVQANFAEYVPFALLLVGLAEQDGAPPAAVHVAGAALLIARLAHAVGVSRSPEDVRYRVVGVVLTMTVLGLACLTLLVRRFVLT